MSRNRGCGCRGNEKSKSGCNININCNDSCCPDECSLSGVIGVKSIEADRFQAPTKIEYEKLSGDGSVTIPTFNGRLDYGLLGPGSNLVYITDLIIHFGKTLDKRPSVNVQLESSGGSLVLNNQGKAIAEIISITPVVDKVTESSFLVRVHTNIVSLAPGEEGEVINNEFYKGLLLGGEGGYPARLNWQANW